MKKRALLVMLGPVYSLTKSGYPSFNTARNIKRITELLTNKNWDSIDPILEKTGTKNNIVAAVHSLQKSLENDDILLIYYFGHCDNIKTKLGSEEIGSDDQFDEFLVTYDEELETFPQPYNSSIFLTDNDYTDLMLEYFQRNDSKRLISIFDCCFSQGMVDKTLLNLSNHTIITSSSVALESWTHPTEGSFLSQGLAQATSKTTTLKEYCLALNDYMVANHFPKPFTQIGNSFESIPLIL